MTNDERQALLDVLAFIANSAPEKLGQAYINYFEQTYPDVVKTVVSGETTENRPRTIGFAPIAISKGGSC